MIKSRLHNLMGENKIRSINQLSNDTGISRLTLTNIYNDAGKAIEYETMDKLCRFFNCAVGDLLEYVEKESK